MTVDSLCWLFALAVGFLFGVFVGALGFEEADDLPQLGFVGVRRVQQRAQLAGFVRPSDVIIQLRKQGWGVGGECLICNSSRSISQTKRRAADTAAGSKS